MLAEIWQKSENSDPVMPPKMEQSGNYVILRRNFHVVEATEDRGEHYTYEELQLTSEQYDIFRVFEQEIREQSDALVELAELITEGR